MCCVRTIHENASRLMLWEIEQKPEYRALTNACLDELQACIANQSGPLRRRMVRMFVSSPGSVTPAHFDVEQNLILQIRGKKALTVGRFASPAEEQRVLERWWDCGCNQNIRHSSSRARHFRRPVPVHLFRTSLRTGRSTATSPR